MIMQYSIRLYTVFEKIILPWFINYSLLLKYLPSTVTSLCASPKCIWLFNRLQPILTERHWEAMCNIGYDDLFRLFILYSDHPPSCTKLLQNTFDEELYILGRALYTLKPSYYMHFEKNVFGHSTTLKTQI